MPGQSITTIQQNINRGFIKQHASNTSSRVRCPPGDNESNKFLNTHTLHLGTKVQHEEKQYQFKTFSFLNKSIRISYIYIVIFILYCCIPKDMIHCCRCCIASIELQITNLTTLRNAIKKMYIFSIRFQLPGTKCATANLILQLFVK